MSLFFSIIDLRGCVDMYKFEDMIERIKHIKKESNLTNEDLSQKTNIPIGTLSKILSGNTKDPQISNIIKIAECFEVSADYLIFGKTKTSNLLSDKENKLIEAYRSNPSMQPAIDRLLNISDVNTEAVQFSVPSRKIAAHGARGTKQTTPPPKRKTT